MIERPVYNKDRVSLDDQNLLWFSIDMLLHLDKHANPNIAHATLELSQASDRASKALFLKMHHVIKYVLDTKNLGLKIELTRDGEKLKGVLLQQLFR